ncbi:MAG: hypothetical protein EOO08_03650 [Chitinophagaceae bacterium]|nr:MAG: hypothetical protein EOO08_03650 [Chitinophagaceae bacterium]
MKYLLGTLLLGALLFSCQQPQTPKTLATEFVQHLYALNFDAASKLMTSEGQALLQQTRQQLEQRGSIEESRARRNGQSADDVFDTQTFTETGSGDDVVVQNNQLRINLHKDGGDWKVAATSELVDALVNHPLYADAAQTAWNNLQGECDKRTKLVGDYATMRSSRGENTPELKALEAALRDCNSAKTGTAAERADYMIRQEKLQSALEKALSPAMNASADFTLNYIVQLSDYEQRIRTLKQQYGLAAAKAHVKDLPALP